MGRSKETIVAEDRLKEMFDTLVPFTGSNGGLFQPIFRYGDQKELSSFLKTTQSQDKPYPLIWLEYPYTESHTINRVKLEGVSLVLAVESNSVMYNPERLESSFKEFLLPLWDNINQTFRRSNTIDTVENFTLTKFPNYDTRENKNKTTTIWDAVKVTFDCSINSNCFKAGKVEPNPVDYIYYPYKTRVELAGGRISSEECTRAYIESLINQD
tara:strand:+ start:871 stop:1509 length:639 start_codon:yes stop_codon:yes gene_type:complete